MNRKINHLFYPFIFLSLFLISCSASLAQAPFLSATASKSTVVVNEQFQVTFSLSGAGRSFQGPNLSDFNVLSGPNQSNSIQVVNQSFSQTISYSYIVAAKGEGSFKIGPASIEIEGKRIASNVINISVVKANSQGGQQGTRTQQQGGNQDQNSGLSDKNIFMRAIVSKTNVFRGEAITVKFKLYSNVPVVNYAVDKMPTFTGFWNQDIALPQQLQLNNENVDGINYPYSGILKSVVLFPQQSGTLTIDPMELFVIARLKVKASRSSDPFGFFQNDPFADAFFGGVRDVKYAFKSVPVKITVRELPPNPPAGFSGNVGRLNFDASLDKNETKANEPVSLKVKISGSGNIKLCDAPKIDFPQDMEAYDPKINENLKTSEAGVSGTKSFEYLLIPRHEGKYTIDPIQFSYFDLEKKQYVTQKSQSFTINVTRGTGQSAYVSSPSSTSKSDVQVIGKDIRYIKVKTPDFSNSDGSFYGSFPFYALSFAPVLLFAGIVLYRKRLDKLSSNQSLLRSKKATAIAQKRLAAADKLLKARETNAVYDEVSKALWGYVSDKLTVPISELSKESIANLLQSRKVSETTSAEFLDTLALCEFARYGGTNGVSEADKIYERGLQLITKLEGEIKA